MNKTDINVHLVVIDPEEAGTIWNTHMEDGLLAGCRVTAIADGNAISDRDDLEGFSDYLQNRLNEEDISYKQFEVWKKES
jgi:hypothetical protein